MGDQLEEVPSMWVKIDPQNTDHTRIAIDTLGAVQLTLDLPKFAMPRSEWGFIPDGTEDKRPGSEGGHQVVCGRHDSGALWLVTWGLQIPASFRFVQAYTRAVNTVIDRCWMQATGLSPANLNIDQTNAEVARLAA